MGLSYNRLLHWFCKSETTDRNHNYDLYEFLISLDIIVDSNQENGITLCRECHKKEHINFGSHNPIVK
jgi:hypothetical protein